MMIMCLVLYNLLYLSSRFSQDIHEHSHFTDGKAKSWRGEVAQGTEPRQSGLPD